MSHYDGHPALHGSRHLRARAVERRGGGGLDFRTILIRFLKTEHKSPHFKNLNPKGKVPTLIVNGAPITENVAIITCLNRRFPGAQLMPRPSTLVGRSPRP